MPPIYGPSTIVLRLARQTYYTGTQEDIIDPKLFRLYADVNTKARYERSEYEEWSNDSEEFGTW
jgi:hypothetical protein